MTARPFLTPRAYIWVDKAGDGARLPGVALMHGGRVAAHLTPAEARQLADELHDLADHTDTPRQADTPP